VIAKLVLAVSLGAFASAAVAKCTESKVELRGDWGTARFSVELADDDAERALGLMNRPAMPASSGMLFLYPEPQRVGFWMENTLIPLDMLFIGPDGVVQKIHENAIPRDRTTIFGGSNNILAVLEINGGMARSLGITEGSQLRYPLLDQEIAAWPCEDGS
jgi:hypothetical protein